MRSDDRDRDDGSDLETRADAAHEREVMAGEASALDRRRLLRGVASGLVLGASGLWLPPQAAEVEASAGAMGGRHGGDQRGRHRHRRHGQRKRRHERARNQQQRGEPLPGIRGIELQVANSVHPGINVVFRREGVRDAFDERFISSGGDHTFQTAEQEGLLWIENRYFIGVFNPTVLWPKITRMGYGGSYPGRYWIDGVVVINDRTMFENGAAAVMDVDNRHFSIKRLTDGDHHIVFQVDVTG